MNDETTKHVEEARDRLQEELLFAFGNLLPSKEVTAAIGDLIDAKIAQARAKDIER